MVERLDIRLGGSPTLFLAALAILILITVPLTGGRLSRLADVRLRWTPVIFGALVIQVLIVTIFPGGDPALHRDLHLFSYVLIAAFLVANRHRPGLLAIAAGALFNAIAIAANNGVMPASASALRAAGEPTTTKTFMNSTVLAHPRVAFLGDITTSSASATSVSRSAPRSQSTPSANKPHHAASPTTLSFPRATSTRAPERGKLTY
jgi:Family of unknown function (DUF5317)